MITEPIAIPAIALELRFWLLAPFAVRLPILVEVSENTGSKTVDVLVDLATVFVTVTADAEATKLEEIRVAELTVVRMEAEVASAGGSWLVAEAKLGIVMVTPTEAQR